MSRGRLLVVTQHFYPENFRINDLVSGLSDIGYHIDVLCGYPNYPRGEWFDGYDGHHPKIEHYHNVTIYRSYEIPRKGNTSFRIFLNYVSWPWFARSSINRLGCDYDAVLCYNTSPVLMIWPAILAAKRSNCPLITYVLDLWPENLYSVLPIKNRLLRILLSNMSNMLYEKSNILVTVSNAMKDRLKKRLSKDHAYYVIPQHAEDFYTKRIVDNTLTSQYAGKIVFLFTGNLSPAQNLDVVIKAIVKARRITDKNIHLLVIGDGMSKDNLKSLVSELDANEYVEFTGAIPPRDIPKYASIANATILSLSSSPNLSLTIPAKLSSYMALGKPIIGSIDGEPASIIKEAGCGFVCQPDDQETLANIFAEYAEITEDQMSDLSYKSYSYYEQNYQKDICILKIDRVIQTAISTQHNR